jgi:pimeloyl-ACP methyl ester carboxylesterase/DNA-binding winged helix-turn-helix (wHTH) protein
MLRQLREAPISKLPTAPLWLCNEQWSLPNPALVSADKMTSHVGDVRLCCVLSKALLGLTMARYLFGNYLLDLDERRLLRDNEEIRLRGKLLDTLRLLVENAGKLVRKDAFMESVWPDSVVEDNNLDYCISQLRKLFHPAKYIETVPRHGYRFVARVERTDAPIELSAGSIPRRGRQEIRYCMTSDDVRLAYASIGAGPPLVKASNWLTHLDLEWESPLWRHWWGELSRHHRVIRYDERGNGMSQRDVPHVSFETWVQDLEAVVDVVELERFALLGISRGAAIAIAYTVRHPERVSHLVLYGAFAAGLNYVGTAEDINARRALIDLIRLGWGLHNPAFCRVFTCRFIPNATPEHEQWFDDLQRISTSPENAARLMETDDKIDVRGLLPLVRVPTLVVHCDHEKAVPAEYGRQIAAAIPGARYVSLPSANHLILEEEPAWKIFLEELADFLGWRAVPSAS